MLRSKTCGAETNSCIAKIHIIFIRQKNEIKGQKSNNTPV
jgi:hypothetical protein